jgi:hypothetical protein
MWVDMLARWCEKGVDGPPTHRREGGSGRARACGYTYYSSQTTLLYMNNPIPIHPLHPLSSTNTLSRLCAAFVPD